MSTGATGGRHVQERVGGEPRAGQWTVWKDDREEAESSSVTVCESERGISEGARIWHEGERVVVESILLTF